MEILYARVACEVSFSFEFLTFQNVSKIHFKLKGSYAHKSQNITPKLPKDIPSHRNIYQQQQKNSLK
jgi:hypothetical protein